MKKFAILFFTFIFLHTLPSLNEVHAQESIFDVSPSLLNNDDEFLSVKEAFIFDFHQQNDKLKISFNIKDGYYLYRHQFRFTPENAQIAEVGLPRGIDHEDEFFGVQQIFTDELNFTINLTSVNENGLIKIRYQGCASKGLCYPPETIELSLSLLKGGSAEKVLTALNTENESTVDQNNSASESSEQYELADMLKGDSLLITLLAFFAGGLLLSFTPCVFPMYPILTGIIVGQGENLSTKRAFSLSFFYVQGMAITYTILGIVVALAGAQFQAMFQHPAVLISLSILFIFLALSMFGVFNLALPSSLQNKLNNMSNKQKGGSYTGVLIMGAISGLVASPCTTAPLTGALIFIAESGDIITGASALYALSLGMGLPLLVLGSSGGKILPKAGNWMNVIKNVFGLLLLAVPVFLLERFISETATQVLWSVLLLASAGYFYVVNQSTKQNFWFGARAVIIFVMLFFASITLYHTVFPNQQVAAVSEEHHFVQVNNLKELKNKVAEANEQGLYVMVDLYADWCVACKEFEKFTFSKPSVQKSLEPAMLIQIDLTETGSDESIELMEHFDVFGLPSILFFDTQGNELSLKRVTGFMDEDRFNQHLATIF